MHMVMGAHDDGQGGTGRLAQQVQGLTQDPDGVCQVCVCVCMRGDSLRTQTHPAGESPRAWAGGANFRNTVMGTHRDSCRTQMAKTTWGGRVHTTHVRTHSGPVSLTSHLVSRLHRNGSSVQYCYPIQDTHTPRPKRGHTHKHGPSECVHDAEAIPSVPAHTHIQTVRTAHTDPLWICPWTCTAQPPANTETHYTGTVTLLRHTPTR